MMNEANNEKNNLILGRSRENVIKKVIIEIKPDIAVFIEEFSALDTNNERGGILTGKYTEKEDSYFVEILGAVEAKYTESARSSVKFTHQSWDYVNTEKEKRFPDQQVVGWFHTHPGFGIFLSEYDLFIHRHFFNLPWQVAYVVDPVKEKRGFFSWQGKEILPLSKDKEIGMELMEQRKKANKLKKRKMFFSLILSVIFILLVSCLAVIYSQHGESVYDKIKNLSHLVLGNE